MTLAWIIYRAREPVRELIEAYRAASLVWRHTGQFSINSVEPEKVFELLPPEPKNAFDVAYEARYRDVQRRLDLSGRGGSKPTLGAIGIRHSRRRGDCSGSNRAQFNPRR